MISKIQKGLVLLSLSCVLGFGVNALADEMNAKTNFASECQWYCNGGFGSAPVPCGWQCDQAVRNACGNSPALVSC